MEEANVTLVSEKEKIIGQCRAIKIEKKVKKKNWLNKIFS